MEDLKARFIAKLDKRRILSLATLHLGEAPGGA